MSRETTVLISVFNQAPSLDRCLASVAAQTYRDFDVVCVDDGSHDGSLAILQAWKKKCAQAGIPFTLVSLPANEGLTRALNHGLEKVSGTYLARLDGDDWWQAEKLAKQVAVFRSNPEFVIVGSWYVNVYPDREHAVRLPETPEHIARSITTRNPFGHSCVVLKTDAVRRVGGYDPAIRYGQDWDLWLRLRPRGKMSNIPEYLCWRTAGQGVSRRKQKEQMKQAIATSIKYLRLYKRPLHQYAYLLTPLLIIWTPAWLKKLYGHFSSH
jgi:glycosyltransferase involved in cell wall biosynthesis